MAEIEADVIIVGSGVSGALLGAKLAQAGVKVAILEAGARVDRAVARPSFWNVAIRVPECPYPLSPQAEHPLSNDPDYWYRQTGHSAKTGLPSASSWAMTVGRGPKVRPQPRRQILRGSVCATPRSTPHCVTKPRASLLEQLPKPENRVTLDPDVSDMYGVPLPRIAYRLGEYIQAGL